MLFTMELTSPTYNKIIGGGDECGRRGRRTGGAVPTTVTWVVEQLNIER